MYISVWNGGVDELFPADYRSSQVISQEQKHLFRSVVFFPLGLVRQLGSQSWRRINPGLELVDPLAVTHSLDRFNSLAEPIPLLLFVVRLARDESRAENLMRIHVQMFN